MMISVEIFIKNIELKNGLIFNPLIVQTIYISTHAGVIQFLLTSVFLVGVLLFLVMLGDGNQLFGNMESGDCFLYFIP
jgi:hypothetical protein